MKRKLLGGILVLALLPLIASYFLVRDIVARSVSLGLNSDVSQVLRSYQEDLKELRKLQPAKQDEYRARFERTQNLQAVYEDNTEIKTALEKSLFTFYIIGASLVILAALAIALTLSRRVSQMFQQTLDALSKERERAKYLEEISQWQSIAQKLAHEIKGPLTPIDLLVSDLARSFETKNQADFREQLLESKKIISEEIGHLRKMVHSFSSFSKLPKPQYQPTELGQFIEAYLRAYGPSWPTARIEFRNTLSSSVILPMDTGLLRQVFMNLLNNAVEANPAQTIHVTFLLRENEYGYELRISNEGTSIPSELRDEIFRVYYSSKKDHEHMGLGLAVVKKILLEHGWQIECVERSAGAEFLVQIPKSLTSLQETP